MSIHHTLIQSLTGDNDELVVQFFVTFSRFEYALKRAGYVKGSHYASADWNSFAKKKLETKIASVQNPEFIKAKAFLLDAPPQKQIVVNNNHMRWQNNLKRHEEGDAEYVLRLVRDVRNNLFHGGKYPDGIVSEQSLRNTDLLQACLVILAECLLLDDDVKEFFWRFAK